MKTYLILILIIISSLCFNELVAKSEIKKIPVTLQILNKYSSAKGVKAQFIKTDFKKTLGSKKNIPGELQYADGKINISLVGERKSEIIYNGNKLWIIEYPDLDFDPKGKRKVTEIDNHKPALAQQIIGLFQHPNIFLKNFKMKSEKINGKMKLVNFESKDNAIQNFEVEFNIQKMLINSIRFIDDVQTETHIEFSKTEFLKKLPTSIFEYKRKKDDEVM